MIMCRSCETNVENITQHDINKNKRILFPNHYQVHDFNLACKLQKKKKKMTGPDYDLLVSLG